MDDINKLLNDPYLSDKKKGNYKDRISQLENNNLEYQETLDELGVLESSKQVYNIVDEYVIPSAASRLTDNEEWSITDFNFAEGIVNIRLGSRHYSMFAHELKHAYQFETGKLSIRNQSVRGALSIFHDKTDEVEAYNRGHLFGGEKYTMESLPVIYRSLPNYSRSAQNFPQYITDGFSENFQNIAKKAQMAFRINNTTYYDKK